MNPTSLFVNRLHPWVKDAHQLLGNTMVGLAISHALLSRAWLISWVRSKRRPA